MEKVMTFDLDGTLALIEHRRHYVECERSKQNWRAFYKACPDDQLNKPVAELFFRLAPHYKIHILSGRSDEVRKETIEWLGKHGLLLPGVTLTMRSEGDFTPDDVLKKQWATEIGLERILCAFDDRKKVVDMWRSLGIACLQVADGNF